MNIFAVSSYPTACARALDDSRLSKMQLETAQMLCTDMRRRGRSVPYRSTHAHHPVVRWLAHDGAFRWAVSYFEALDVEWRWRGHDRHASFALVHPLAVRVAHSLPLLRRPTFVNAAARKSLSIDFTHVRPATLAYREYLAARWDAAERPPTWGRRGPPRWYS